ncbi:sel1 repeat family protein [Pelomyxa schiedti]|nr:sel1 repeat family protein [Pelomyxa schiedti]
MGNNPSGRSRDPNIAESSVPTIPVSAAVAAETTTPTISNSNSNGASAQPPQPPPPRDRPSVVGYDEFQRVLRDRAAFFTAMSKSVTVAEVQNSSGSLVVSRNFRLVRKIAHGCNGIVFEVKCIGEGHPQLFKEQSYVLKVPFNYGHATESVQNAFENEYLISSTLVPHPNINQYFCHFTDRVPQEYCDHLPEVAKEYAFDKARNRPHACMWVVLEYHSGTLEQFLRCLNTTAPQSTDTITTPWPIVHKYSRDICAALVHLFENRIIHFDIKLDNIVISSNKEQAILIDLGCAMKFPRNNRPFETQIVALKAAQGNQSHRAPEIINVIAEHTQNPDRVSMFCCDKQPSFELGCILFELAMCGEHPLPGFPGGYGPSGQITFSFESEEEFPMKPPAFPKEFCNLVRSLLQNNPDKRMPLLKAADVLSNIDPPEFLPFYNSVIPQINDAGTLTGKAICQILYGSAQDCADTLYMALELEPLFSPALLLLRYLNSCSTIATPTQHSSALASLTGKTATFTATDVEFTRAIINKKHRNTLPELTLTALWTRHISHEACTATQLLLKKIAAVNQQVLSITRLASLFLWSVINTRNEMMMEALSQLDSGKIDSALDIVANATSLFEEERRSILRTEWMIMPANNQFEYLPGLLLLFILCFIVNDHVTLGQHIPASLAPAFSHAVSSSFVSMRAQFSRVLNKGEIWKKKFTAEWSELVTIAETAGKHSLTTPEQTQRLWACLHFVALWRTLCTSTQCVAPLWVELSSIASTCESTVSTPVGHIHWRASSLTHLGICYNFGVGGVDTDIHKAVSHYREAADAGSAMAMLNLALCYVNGNGVDKDIHEAVSLYKRAADAGDAMAMCALGVHYEKGSGVDKDIHKAVSLYQRAADSGDTMSMFNLALCYLNGIGVDKDIHKAVSLYQRAADAGNAMAMCNLGVHYENGNGVYQDIHKAVSLYQRAADAGSAHAMHNLGVCYVNGTGVDKDTHKAVSLYKRAADAGDVMAMCNLGVHYENGNGVDKDIHKAVSLYQRAADACDAHAICALGVHYENGNGVDKDIHKAVSLYQRAADAGNANAMFNLGVCYLNGTGVYQDIRKAVSLYQRASDAGNANAMYNLGLCYVNGTGVYKDIRKAVFLYQRAADAGNAMAMLNLGVCYLNGNGVEKDIHKAVALYQRAADAGDAMAMLNLGVHYENGNGVDKDIHKAVSLYQRAADAGDAHAMHNLGLCYDNGNGVDKDIHKAVSLYQRAADAGSADSMCALGVCYVNGNGVDKDIHKAVSLYQRAADAGSAHAILNLGVCHENGTGVDKDIHKAVSLYKRAADAGSAKAMFNLGLCYRNGIGVDKDIQRAKLLLERAAQLGDARATLSGSV